MVVVVFFFFLRRRRPPGSTPFPDPTLFRPQVAARAAHHWQVAKRVEEDVTLSTVTSLNGAARVDEIARMLSGDRISKEARAAAEKLMTG